ncbi:hypothetical protein NWF32_25330 [Pseudomonas qingdaonensis]|nr:hypothetical protein [Pseudomonas qingdaonensis]
MHASGHSHVKAEEDAWVEDVYSFYGDAATEELDCVPSQGGGAYFSLALIESRTSRDVPVVRYKCAQGYETTAEHTRLAETEEWCERELGPLLADLPKGLQSFYGMDFARSGDLRLSGRC